jgi:SAM-dependent methyltransferase
LISVARRCSDAIALEAGFVCPACRYALSESASAWECAGCGRAYPAVAGLPDFRLEGDHYLSLEGDRAKAERLARIEPRTDLAGLANAYYAMTDDVDARRRARFVAHIARAESRSAALADLLPRHGRILEVGCGSGGLLAALARGGRVVVGVDIALRWLIVARRRLSDLGLSAPLFAASADRLPWADGTFDAVVADSVLEHLDDPAQALREWRRVLRPSGRLVVWSPNRLALTTDPHVGLWGVGWLPTSWASAYVRALRGCAWTVLPLTSSDARRLAISAGFRSVQVEPPHLQERGSVSSSLVDRLLLRLYGLLIRWRAPRALLLEWGPLWQLSARKEGPP